jgi:hypothetical protein
MPVPYAGVDCKYRHALPPGFVLKADKKAKEEAAKKEVISLEDFLETEVRIHSDGSRFLPW